MFFIERVRDRDFETAVAGGGGVVVFGSGGASGGATTAATGGGTTGAGSFTWSGACFGVA